MSSPVHISYFSDLLCVWAYVSQIRLDELERRFGAEIEVRHHFVPIFGATAHRIGTGWKDRGGFEGYAAHVVEVCEGFPQVELSADAWTTVRPTSSAPGHVLLSAVRLALESDGAATAGRTIVEELAWQIRLAFFRDGRDVSSMGCLEEIAGDLDIPMDPVRAELGSGRALALMCRDIELRDALKVEGSPTYVLNHGRQKLYGNLGYRVIEANVEELLRRPHDAASWC